MTDGIIKGTGNSRFLKGPADILSKYPTWEAAAAALAAGTFAVDLNGINAAGWTTQGTALNKANLLTDALCTALGLATTATPTQAMEKLRTLVNTAQTGVDNGPKVTTGSYRGNGKYGYSDKNTLNFQFYPKFVIIASGFSNSNFCMFVRSANYACYISSNDSIRSGDNTVGWGDTSITWYSDVDSQRQLNTVNTYYYFAIG